jgi:E3 ubiquitin-protein ligase MYCBP2
MQYYAAVIHLSHQDGFVVRMVNPTSSPVVSLSELPLKLARKCLDVFGTASFDEDANSHTIHTGCDEETVFIAAGKDFGLLRTNSGKVGAKVSILLLSIHVF